jgi:hypothetical protein
MSSRPNDELLLEEWSRQRDDEDGDKYLAWIGDTPQHICEAYERSVTDVDANIGAAVQGDRQHVARHHTPTPVSKKFPGERGVMRANIIPFLLVIFRLMEQICPHVEVGSRNRRATSKWKELTDRFFDRTDGMGRNFQLWAGEDGWKKAWKAVLAGVCGHSMAYEQNAGAPSEVQILARGLEEEIMNANTQHQARVGTTTEVSAERQGRLEAAQQGMGLTMPSQGAQPPTLDFALNNFQAQALAEFGQNSVSPANPSGTSSAGRITPRDGESAFTPVTVAGNDPPAHPCPGLPTFFTSANTPLPDAAQNNFPSAQNFPANLGQQATDAATSRQQSNIAAGNIGNRFTVSSGTRTRQMDQVDVLHLMNEQMMQGIANLNNLVPSAADQRRVQLEGAISSALSRMAQYTAMGMSTDAISRHILVLEKELDAHMDARFVL